MSSTALIRDLGFISSFTVSILRPGRPESAAKIQHAAPVEVKRLGLVIATAILANYGAIFIDAEVSCLVHFRNWL